MALNSAGRAEVLRQVVGLLRTNPSYDEALRDAADRVTRRYTFTRNKREWAIAEEVERLVQRHAYAYYAKYAKERAE
jgi:hypothetical protein